MTNNRLWVSLGSLEHRSFKCATNLTYDWNLHIVFTKPTNNAETYRMAVIKMLDRIYNQNEYTNPYPANLYKQWDVI